MKKKTPNAQRPTPNVEIKRRSTPVIEWAVGGVRVNELPSTNYVARQDTRRYDLEDRLLDFAVNIVELTESFPTTRSGNHIAGQLLRCGTSPLSNHGEVEAAESRKDFVHKLRICLKELRETRRWLRLPSRLKKLEPLVTLPACLNEVDELIRIFAASVRTAEKNAK
jgi:four helix bundle protein